MEVTDPKLKIGGGGGGGGRGKAPHKVWGLEFYF